LAEIEAGGNAAVTYAIDTDRRIVYLRVRSTPTLEDAERVLVAAFSDERYVPGFACLVDRTATEPPTTQYVRGLTTIFRRHRDLLTPSRVAVVVASQATYGMFRMLQSLGVDTPAEMEIFRDHEEAEAWIRGGQGPRRGVGE